MTAFLVDTNVLSETARPAPAAAVVAWLGSLDRILVSSVTWFELRRGIDALVPSKRRTALEAWIDGWVEAGIEVLPFDREAATAAARIEVAAQRRGRTVEVRDLFVLATAAAAGLGLATRDVRGLSGLGVALLDPFASRAGP